jgi:hypothetical protein
LALNAMLTFTLPPGEPDPPDKVSDGCAALPTATAVSQIKESFAEIRRHNNRVDLVIFGRRRQYVSPF